MMKSLDAMPASEVVELYYSKHQAIRDGDMLKLLAMKKQYPDLFDAIVDKQISEMIEYAKAFQSSDRYKELHRQSVRDKLSIVETD